MKPENVRQHIRNMQRTQGWQILLVHLNQVREAILDDGKSGRAEEKMRRVWAKLDGFDEAVKLAERLAHLPDSAQVNIPLEDSE